MDVPPPSPPPPTTATTTTGNVVSGPEPEPPNAAGPKRMAKHPPPPLTNDVLRRHPPPSMSALSYGKCNKNYSASTGGRVLDGCGEFMPSRSSTPTDPTFLNCDACGCHRSFHRQTDHYCPPLHHVIDYQCPPHNRHQRLAAKPRSSSAPNSPSPSPISSSYYPMASHLFFPGLQPQPATANHIGKKRFRSRFSVDQKEKMQGFAERIGWKMLKKDEGMIMGFCMDIGVTKRVFKVWMHNHKKKEEMLPSVN
ncbi:hypothetical protein R6Q59_008328 [Mikania micrantha]